MSDRWFGVGRTALSASLALVACGCSQGLFDNDQMSYRATPEKLTKITSTDIVGESMETPITPEDATKAALEKGDPTPTWPAKQEISLVEVRESALKNNLDLRTLLVDPA